MDFPLNKLDISKFEWGNEQYILEIKLKNWMHTKGDLRGVCNDVDLGTYNNICTYIIV